MTESAAGADERSPAPSAERPGLQRLVLRNTLFLTLGQIVSLPLSTITNVLMARYLGPEAFGYIYLGITFNAFGFLAVDWGQTGSLPALVATDRSRAGRLLGTTLVWRLAASVVVFGALTLLRRALRYDAEVQTVIELIFVFNLLTTLVNACQHTIVGFERIDVAAVRQVIEQISVLLFIVPILLLGGRLHATLIGQA